jgi:tetratricopeptide (TPR) repeat protein
VEVYEDILEADKERYGESDLVCAIDYHNLGVASLLANDLDSALIYFQQAVILKRTLLGQNDPTVSDSLVEIGIILYNRNDNAGAISIFKEALEIRKDSNDSEGMGRISNNIGCVYYQMGDIASALDYLQEALVAQRMVLGMSEKAEASLLSFALTQSNIGYLKLKAGHLDAITVLEESLLVLESVIVDDDITVETVRSNVAIAKLRVHHKNESVFACA